MLSKSEIKELKSLHQKKYREAMERFLAEGDKLVQEAMASEANIREIYALANWEGMEKAQSAGIPVEIIDQKQLLQICELRNPNMAVALINMPQANYEKALNKGWNIYLDRVRDPGNLGTILRIADWYGIPSVICSPDSVEVYNQKVIQSSMGAVFRVQVIEMSEDELINSSALMNIKLYAAVMDGENIHRTLAPSQGVLLMGNEAKGLSNKLIEASYGRISIPQGGAAESLNVGVATGILVDWALRGLANN
jgi:TrmH family RNA methyltransferase